MNEKSGSSLQIGSAVVTFIKRGVGTCVGTKVAGYSVAFGSAICVGEERNVGI